MLRRHLRLPSSSDDDEDAPPPQTLITPNPNTLLEISDDDFMDVPEDLSPPVAEAPPGRAGDSAAFASAPGGMEEETNGFTRQIDDFLRSLGLRLRPEWLESCAATLMASGSDFSRLDVAGRAKRCFEQFLLSDMNTSGAGVLPEYVHRLHKTELEGPFVLQIDEIVNISAPIRERYHEVPVGYKRCLKLSMTDGVQRVFGMEYRPIKELEVLASSGLKVVVHNVHIRRGLLMLVPEQNPFFLPRSVLGLRFSRGHRFSSLCLTGYSRWSASPSSPSPNPKLAGAPRSVHGLATTDLSLLRLR